MRVAGGGGWGKWRWENGDKWRQLYLNNHKKCRKKRIMSENRSTTKMTVNSVSAEAEAPLAVLLVHVEE